MTTSSIPSVDVESDPSTIPSAISELGFLFLQSPSTPSPEAVAKMFEIAGEFFLVETPEEKAKVIPHVHTVERAG